MGANFLVTPPRSENKNMQEKNHNVYQRASFGKLYLAINSL